MRIATGGEVQACQACDSTGDDSECHPGCQLVSIDRKSIGGRVEGEVVDSQRVDRPQIDSASASPEALATLSILTVEFVDVFWQPSSALHATPERQQMIYVVYFAYPQPESAGSGARTPSALECSASGQRMSLPVDFHPPDSSRGVDIDRKSMKSA